MEAVSYYPLAADQLVKERTAEVLQIRAIAKSMGFRLPDCSAECFHNVAKGDLPKELSDIVWPLMKELKSKAVTIKTVEKQMRPVERITMALPNKKAVAHLYIVDSGIGCGAEARPYHKAMDKEKRSCQFSLQRHHTGKGTLCPDRPITCPDG